NFDNDPRIPANVAAVGQNLALQFADQAASRQAEMPNLLRHAERRVGKRDSRVQSRYAVSRVICGDAQEADLPRQAAQQSSIEPQISVVENERGLAEPGHQTARHDFRPPRNRVPGALYRDPFVDERAGVAAGYGRIGGTEMA